jgi:hypothetical protein
MLESEAITNILVSMPEAQRAQVREILKSKIQRPFVKQCINSDWLNNVDEKFKEAMGGLDDCQFKVSKSSRTEFVWKLICAGHSTELSKKVISSKRQAPGLVSSMGGAGQNKICTISELKSSVCPECVTL